jgi:hypothetical protein
MADFINLTTTPEVENPTNSDKLIVISDGEIKQISTSKFADNSLTSTPTIEEPAEGDNLVIISNGQVKQISASNFAAASGNGGGLPPVYIYNSSTNGHSSSNSANILDTNNVGITNGMELYQYMLIGGPVYYIGYSHETYQNGEYYYSPTNDVIAPILSLYPDENNGQVYYSAMITYYHDNATIISGYLYSELSEPK